jgi:biotin synthase
MKSASWNRFADKALKGTVLSREESSLVLGSSPSETASLVAAAYRVRHKYFGNRIKLNYLVNAKSGNCREDCHYCSQSRSSKASINKYPWITSQEMIAMAERAIALHAGRFCIAASGRKPNAAELTHILGCVKAVRKKYPRLEICCSLGLLEPDQAEALKHAGVHAVNHNLNTSERFHKQICATHTYADRAATVRRLHAAGLSVCCGALLGMGETEEDIIDLAYALREMKVESLPVNFLMPVDGTPLAGRDGLSPTRCLNILCLYRFLNPEASLRIAGGREIHLRSLQAMALYVANSIFIGDYLTAKGQPVEADLAMIRDLGFEIEGDSKS